MSKLNRLNMHDSYAWDMEKGEALLIHVPHGETIESLKAKIELSLEKADNWDKIINKNKDTSIICLGSSDSQLELEKELSLTIGNVLTLKNKLEKVKDWVDSQLERHLYPNERNDLIKFKETLGVDHD